MEWLGEFFNSFFNDIYQLAVQFGAWLAVKMIVSWLSLSCFCSPSRGTWQSKYWSISISAN